MISVKYFLVFGLCVSLKHHFVGNKTNRRILKQSPSNFPKNEHFLQPDTRTYVRVSGSKKCLFFGKFGVLCFPETPVLRFAILPYYRRFLLLNGDPSGDIKTSFMA